MQNAHTALRLLRKFFAPGVVFSCHTLSFSKKKGAHNCSLQYADWASGKLRPVSHIPLHLQLCRRAPLRLQKAGLSGSAEATVAVDPIEANVFAEQICASRILEGTIAQEKNKIFESNTIEDTIALEKSRELSSPELRSELPERLHRIEHMVEQHGRSLASLSSQLEGQTQLFASILEDIKLLRADTRSKVQYLSPSHGLDSLEIDNVSASSSTQLSAVPWPEWTSFLLHLKGLPFFKEVVEVADVGGPMTFDDPITVKRTVAKFSQAYEYIFESLSVTHLRVLAEHGCPNDDRRTVASGKRLQNQFQIEGKMNSCGIGFSKPSNANAKLSDVMRLIYTIAEVAKKDGTPDPVKLSILHLLEEITSMTSNCKHGNIMYPETFKVSGSVLQKPPIEKKSQNVEAKIGLEGSSSSCDVEMVSRSDKWKCPRCFRMNRQSKSKCVECSFQRLRTIVSDVDSAIQNSNLLSENRIDTKVSVSGEETKVASKKFVEMHHNRQANGSPEQGLGDVPRRLLAAQEQQDVTLCEEDENDRGSAGIRDDCDNADEHSYIFDDILDCDNASSPIVEQDTSKKCSLSDLVRQNKKAFSSLRREREQGAATAAEDYERKGVRSFSGGKGYKHEDLDVNTRRVSYRAERDDSVMEAEDKDMVLRRSGGGWTSAGSSMGIKCNQSYNYKVSMGGKVSSGRTNSDDRSGTKGRQHYSREEDSDEDSQRYGSAKTYGNERPRYRERKPCSDRRGDSDNESEECGSRAERGGGLERKRRNEGRMRY